MRRATCLREDAEQNRAQLAEIENLKVHGRTLENRVIRSEEQLARLQERVAQRNAAGRFQFDGEATGLVGF